MLTLGGQGRGSWGVEDPDLKGKFQSVVCQGFCDFGICARTDWGRKGRRKKESSLPHLLVFISENQVHFHSGWGKQMDL